MLDARYWILVEEPDFGGDTGWMIGWIDILEIRNSKLEMRNFCLNGSSS